MQIYKKKNDKNIFYNLFSYMIIFRKTLKINQLHNYTYFSSWN